MSLKSLHLWKGIKSDDYCRACSKSDYINVLDVGNSSALVLGDEPCQTAIHVSDKLGVILVRWQWAENEDSVKGALNNLTSTVFKEPDEVIEYRVDESELKLFDSVDSGQKADGLFFELQSAKYLVSTICYNPNNETSLILHQFSVIP